MWFIPMVRTDVQCFGRDCYPVVFAINTILIIMATGKFVEFERKCQVRREGTKFSFGGTRSTVLRRP